MNNILKNGAKLLWAHILASVVTVFCFFVFAWLIDKYGMYYFSVITASLYVMFIYSEAWNIGNIEGKSYNEIKESPIRALLYSLVPFSLGLVFIVLVYFNISADMVKFISRLWYIPFLGLFTSEETFNIMQIFLASIVLPIIAVIGYYTGSKDFSLLKKYDRYKAKRRQIMKEKMKQNK